MSHSEKKLDRKLLESDVDRNPFIQFGGWFNEALATVREARAMTVATATSSGQPSARIVLLRTFDESGFVFYTNYESRKGKELLENPRASLVFHWGELSRSVRIEGDVEKVSTQTSDEYYQSRPFGNQLAAYVSHQSEVIKSREIIDSRARELEEEYRNRKIPRPEYWGGYRVIPSSFEFWQARPNRLHDRLRYIPHHDGGWQIQRLSP